MPENRTKTGQFAPGTSGNPGGRPKAGEQERAARDAMKALCLDAVELLKNTMANEDAPLALRLRAAEFVINSVCGKAISSTEVDKANDAKAWDEKMEARKGRWATSA